MIQFELHGTTIKVYWIVALTFIVLTYLIVNLSKRATLKSIVKSFNRGITDISLLEKCEKQKKFYRFSNTTFVYDTLCCIVAAIALENKDQRKFIENIHQIKVISGDIEHRLKILFLSYLTEQKYIDLSAAYQKRSPDKKGDANLILAMYDELISSTKNANEKIQSLSDLMERSDLREILFSFKTRHLETGDGA